MKVLIIGSGGREHALCWKIAQSPIVDQVYCAPGNAGMGNVATLIDIPVHDHQSLINFAREQGVGLTIVGPEAPLSAGIANEFEQAGLRIFGPSREAAVVEGSKCFTKEFCVRHGIPTAPFRIFEKPEAAKTYLTDKNTYPIVIKADGLAAGKGVIVAKNEAEALSAVDTMMLEKRFGVAGERIVIEEFMKGEEATFMVATDSQFFLSFESAQDHKRIFDHDEGPNTGGMGAYSPATIVGAEVQKKIESEIVIPFLQGMRAEGRAYVGILYVGLMIDSGQPRLVEFNCRFGDPEAQAILYRLDSDLVALIDAVLDKRCAQFPVRFNPQPSLCVVMTAAGYPDQYQRGQAISGLDEVNRLHDVVVFHAGTKRQDGQWLTDGGRVLGVTAQGENLVQARDRAYAAVEKIHWQGAHWRRDIGIKGLKGGEES